MKNVMIALDPKALDSKNTRLLLKEVKQLQEAGLLNKVHATSIIGPHMFSEPNSWYNKNKKAACEKLTEKMVKEIKSIGLQCGKIRALAISGSTSEELVSTLSRFSLKVGADTLILLSKNQEGVGQLVLGSFCEAAVLTAKLPVLAYKPKSFKQTKSKNLTALIGIDPQYGLSGSDISYLKKLCQGKAQLHLAYVESKKNFLDVLVGNKQNDKVQSKEKLQALKKKLQSQHIHAEIHLLDDQKHGSVAHALSHLADKLQCWFVVTNNSPSKTRLQKLLLGSQARRVLIQTPRAFLSLR